MRNGDIETCIEKLNGSEMYQFQLFDTKLYHTSTHLEKTMRFRVGIMTLEGSRVVTPT